MSVHDSLLYGSVSTSFNWNDNNDICIIYFEPIEEKNATKKIYCSSFQINRWLERLLLKTWVLRILFNTSAKKKKSSMNTICSFGLRNIPDYCLESIIHQNFRHLTQNFSSYVIDCQRIERFVQNKTLFQCLKLNGAQHQMIPISLC